MRTLRPAVLGAALAALLWIAHRPAYKGYFSDDDLDNLVMTRQVGPDIFLREFVKPIVAAENFRPMGHLVYKVLGALAGLRFPAYVALLHLLHGVNIVLVWLLLKRMGAPPSGLWAGTLIFAFHMAAFDALWKPMYVFDLLCGTFTLLTLLLYLSGRWLWALIPFWLGYKSKELIVALPVLLLAWEYLAGGRRWRRVIPLAAVSALFTIQALAANAGKSDDYTLRFTLDALERTLPFYGSAMLLIAYAGLALPLLALIQEARVRWGLLFLFLMPAPLWFLPARLFSVYLYVPLIGLAVAMAFLAGRMRVAWTVLICLLWIPGNYYVLRQKRSEALAAAEENRRYVTAAGRFLAGHAGLEAVIHDGGPERMNVWGRIGAIRWFDARPELMVCGAELAEAKPCLEKRRVAVLSWNRLAKTLAGSIRDGGEVSESYIDLEKPAPFWVFGEGWHEMEHGFRWTGPEARVRLRRPAEAARFEAKVNVSELQLREQGPVALEVLVDGRSLGVRSYSQIAWSQQSWGLEPGRAGPVEVTLRAVKPYRPSNGDPRVLGAAVGSFGFAR